MPRKPNSSPTLPRLDDRPRQTIVPAGAMAPVQTTAANSVFAAAGHAEPATKPRAARELMSLQSVQVISGVPLPPNLRGLQGNPYGDLLAKMKPGDHVSLTERNAKTMASHARGLGIKVATRKLSDGRYGVWRVA